MDFFAMVGLGIGIFLLLAIIFIICVRTSNAHRFNKMFKAQKKIYNEFYDKMNFEEPVPETINNDSSLQQEIINENEILEEKEDGNSSKRNTEIQPENQKYIDMLKRFEARRKFLQEQKEKESQQQEQKKIHTK